MPKKWTKEEIDFINKCKTQMTNKQLAERLSCSESQLSYAIKKFRLTRTTKEQYDLIDNILGRKTPSTRYYHGVFTRENKF